VFSKYVISPSIDHLSHSAWRERDRERESYTDLVCDTNSHCPAY
jgi:hypothetical protein